MRCGSDMYGCLFCNTEIENMQSDSSRGDSELQELNKKLAAERTLKEQVNHLIPI